MGCLLKPIIGIIKWILMIIGLITVILAIIIGVAFWQLTQTPSLEKEMHPVVATVADGEKYDRKLQAIEDKILSGQIKPGDPVHLALTEEEVTGKMWLAIEEADIPLNIEDVWVNFKKDEQTGANQIQILGKVDVGLTLKAGIVIEMSIKAGGEPKITVGELAVGKGWLLPKAAKDQIAKLIPSEDALKTAIKAMPVEWSDVSVLGGELVFEGKAKGI